ncbi:MAG: hypothetical protein KDA66_12815 [Planctomycetaceae bacterium]|nr:hypothetical protein [Planctomycetaceae bacterium]
MEISEDGTANRNVVVTLASEGKGISKEERELIAGLYAGGKNDSDDKSIDVTASFKEKLPGDVGGNGCIERLETTLGSVVHYRERFRSTHDFEGLIQKRLHAVDELCAFLADWAQSEANDEQVGRDVHEFVSETVRKDMRNLAMYVLFAQVRMSGDPEYSESQDFLVRIIQFLSERDYVPAPMMAWLSRSNSDSSDGISYFAKLFGGKYQQVYGRSLIEDIPLLEVAQDAESSLRRFAAKTPAVAKLSSGDSLEGIGALMMLAIGEPLNDCDELMVIVRAKSKPFETNGDWDDESGEVSWEHKIEVPGNSVVNVFPALCYASWSFPNQDAQTQLFGRVLLEGKPLGEYVQWRKSLTVGESTDWKLFLLSLKPADDITRRIGEFRFQTTDSSQETRDGLEQSIRSIFDEAMTVDE